MHYISVGVQYVQVMYSYHWQIPVILFTVNVFVFVCYLIRVTYKCLAMCIPFSLPALFIFLDWKIIIIQTVIYIQLFLFGMKLHLG